MFNIGSGEMLLLFVVALMIFGPNRLPEIGKSVGEAMHSFRNAMKSLSEPIMAEVQTQSRQIREAAQPLPQPAAPALPAPISATTTTESATATEPPCVEAVTTAEVLEAEAADQSEVTAELAPESKPEPEPAEEHVPVPMSAPEASA